MDGYPSNAHQAELLETALTGLDLAAERALIASASLLAPPPPSTLPDLNRPLSSGNCACGLLIIVNDTRMLFDGEAASRLQKTQRQSLGCVDPLLAHDK